MKQSPALFVLLFAVVAFGYGTTTHKNIARATYRVFAVNENKAICQWLEKTIGEEKYLDIISNAADDPDYNPLSTNYVSEMSESVEIILGTNAWEFNLKVFEYSVDVQRWIIETVLTKGLDGRGELQTGMQHTCVFDREFDLRSPSNPQTLSPVSFDFSIMHPVIFYLGVPLLIGAIEPTITSRHKKINTAGAFAANWTDAPECAQIEYDKAIAEWWLYKGSTDPLVAAAHKRAALWQLGRTLHYVEDVTVPHHGEISGNWGDVADMLKILGSSLDIDKNIEDIKVSVRRTPCCPSGQRERFLCHCMGTRSAIFFEG